MKTIVLPQISNPAQKEEGSVPHSYQSLFDGYRCKCQFEMYHFKLILIVIDHGRTWELERQKITCLLNIKVSALLVGFVNFAKTIPAMHAWNLIQYLPFHIKTDQRESWFPKKVHLNYHPKYHLNYHPKYTLQRHQYHSQGTLLCCCSDPIPSSKWVLILSNGSRLKIHTHQNYSTLHFTSQNNCFPHPQLCGLNSISSRRGL